MYLAAHVGTCHYCPWQSAFNFSLPPSTLFSWTRDTLCHGKTDGRINILQDSIIECPWNSLGALFKWTCDYRGKKCQCLYRLSAGLFSAERGWHFSSGLFEQQSAQCSQAAQSPHCPPITPSTIPFLCLIFSSCVSLIHNCVSTEFKLLVWWLNDYADYLLTWI